MRAMMLSVAQLDERIDKCLAILADNPHSQVFAALAEAYRKRGEFGRAFAVCKGGLKNHPDYAPAHIVMAKLYLHQGMFDEALESLKKAESSDGVTRSSEQLEVEILIGKREFDRAKSLLDRMRSADRGNPMLKELAAQLATARTASTRVDSTLVSGSVWPIPTAQPEPTNNAATPQSPSDWATWATTIAEKPHVSKVFAVALTEMATMPFSVLAEAGSGFVEVDLVSICAAMFTSIDVDCRSTGSGVVEDLRIEWDRGQIWCHRVNNHVIGFAGENGLSYGAIRQLALDGVGLLNSMDSVK
jgi:hypothetical protein